MLRLISVNVGEMQSRLEVKNVTLHRLESGRGDIALPHDNRVTREKTIDGDTDGANVLFFILIITMDARGKQRRRLPESSNPWLLNP